MTTLLIISEVIIHVRG